MSPADEAISRPRYVAAADWRPSGVEDLEPNGWAALRHPGSAAVSAGPGAGKTEFLAQKAGYLLETGICPAPQRILAISFKRDAASNLGRRVAKRYPDHAQRFVSLTFDAFTKSIVDRFGNSLPTPFDILGGGYALEFSSARQIEDELADIAAAAPPARQRGVRSIPAGRFLPDVVGGWRLQPQVDEEQLDDRQWAAWQWWQRVINPSRPTLDFTAINRLAELLVRTNPNLRRALQATYPAAFVDEFQDTTLAQFTLLETLFLDTGTAVTAVGDPKQRIMGFAGALPNAMDRFASEFNAETYELEWNFRSTADLVALQGPIAELLTGEPHSVVSKALAEEGQVAAQIWRFHDAIDEAAKIAAWIATDIRDSDRRPADFAFVVKQKVASFESDLAQALAQHGIPLRNDDARYGQLTLFELLRNDISELALGILRLALHPTGMSETWVETLQLLNRARGVSDNELGRRASSDLLQRHTRELRSWLQIHPLGSVEPDEAIRQALSLIDEEQLSAFTAYGGADPYDVVLDSLVRRLTSIADSSVDWSDALERTLAEDAAAIMTIHRSKGLEYHTVFILGLDDDQWWSNRSDPEGTLSTFFVGLSRAAHRLIITRATPRARGANTKTFYDILEDAGVPERDGDDF